MSSNIYLYKGDEKYLTNVKIKRVIKESKADDINIVSYDASEDSLESAVIDALTVGFINKEKVVIINNPIFLTKENKDINTKILIDYLDKNIETTTLIINASGIKIDEKLEITKALYKKANVITTNSISEVEFNGWLERECASFDVKIEKSAIQRMYKAFGSDLIQAKNEVDKLTSYVGKQNTITCEVLDELMSKDTTSDIYELVKALYSNNRKKAIEIYLQLSKYQKDTSFFINVISKSFRDNLLVKTMITEGYNQNEISSKLNISSNRTYYMMKDVKNISIDTIEEIVLKLANLDFNIKSGKVDKKTGFEQFLYSF